MAVYATRHYILPLACVHTRLERTSRAHQLFANVSLASPLEISVDKSKEAALGTSLSLRVVLRWRDTRPTESACSAVLEEMLSITDMRTASEREQALADLETLVYVPRVRFVKGRDHGCIAVESTLLDSQFTMPSNTTDLRSGACDAGECNAYTQTLSLETALKADFYFFPFDTHTVMLEWTVSGAVISGCATLAEDLRAAELFDASSCARVARSHHQQRHTATRARQLPAHVRVSREPASRALSPGTGRRGCSKARHRSPCGCSPRRTPPAASWCCTSAGSGSSS